MCGGDDEAAGAEAHSAYREFIPDDSYPRFSKKFLAGANIVEWAEDRKASDPFVSNWTNTWHEKLKEPFKGVTTDGTKLEGLYKLSAPPTEPSATTVSMVSAAEKLLSICTPDQLQRLQHSIDATEWRAWSNPEIYIFRHGVRLEESSTEFIDAVHDFLKASLSPSGYAKVHGCMKVNHFLGQVVDGPGVLNANSYNISLFGTPSLTNPWGWQLTGHHLCMNCLLIGSQQVISPVFMGAEPNVIDRGPDAGLSLFSAQESTARDLMTNLSALPDHTALLHRTQIYPSIAGSALPEWRYHRADQRHLGGAFQDNRMIPYEGLPAPSFPPAIQTQLRDLIRLSLDFLPLDTLAAKLEEIEAHWDQTYFAWIGDWGPKDAFYFKVHSPVTMLEFDHHSGVFLTNREPRVFHIHTVVRSPNGGDYGMELVREWKEREAGKG